MPESDAVTPENVGLKAPSTPGEDPSAKTDPTKVESKDASGLDAPKPPLGKPEDWPEEIGGPAGAEPTRFNDWEKNGRCSDF